MPITSHLLLKLDSLEHYPAKAVNELLETRPLDCLENYLPLPLGVLAPDEDANLSSIT